MSPAENPIDIVDRIAQDLPAEVRAAYYLELNHCRSLPENDEMLRILRVMQILTLLMRDVPERVRAERERLERLFHETMDHLAKSGASAEAHHVMLDKRLAALPDDVARGLRPDLIARDINERFRQQFVQSTLPQTANAMTAVAAQLQADVADFGTSAAMLNHAHRGAAENARQAVENLERSVSDAARTARQAAEQLCSSFRREMSWSIYTLVSLTLVLGLGAGILFQRWLDTPPVPTAQTPPAVEQAPAKIRRPPAR
jgi:hypothetical protein